MNDKLTQSLTPIAITLKAINQQEKIKCGTFEICFGSLCSPIFKQLKDNKVNVDGLPHEKWQRVADAVMTLLVHGYLGGQEGEKVRKKLSVEIAQHIKEKKQQTSPQNTE